jgi:hypothetical protein
MNIRANTFKADVAQIVILLYRRIASGRAFNDTTGIGNFNARQTAQRSADFQSAVSPNCIRPGVERDGASTRNDALQIANLRYGRVQICATRGRSAFTLIEIALALAVIGFALAAIVGVLPFGMDAQRDNRQKTIIASEAGVWMNAIRNGNDGLNNLTNYVIAVSNYVQAVDMRNNNPVGAPRTEFFANPVFIEQPNIVPVNIIGVVSIPKYRPCEDTNVQGYMFIETNTQVNVYCRAMSGSAMDASPQCDDTLKDSTFSYRLTVEIVSTPALANNHDLRLTFRWPVRPTGEAGPGRAVFRTQVSGRLDGSTVQTRAGSVREYFFEPGQY